MSECRPNQRTRSSCRAIPVSCWTLTLPRAGEARAALAPLAELIKSPEHVHTFRLTPLSIWNACAAGLSAVQMLQALREHARYAVPPSVEQEVLERLSGPIPLGVFDITSV